MRRYLFGIAAAFCLVPDPAQGCRVATAGPEYDALIKIESSDPAGGEFWLVFPSVVDGHPFAWVRMDVANSSDVEQQISIVLETEERDELVAARFWSYGAAGLDVNVYVTWQGGSNPCPVIGQKTIKLSD